MQRGSARLPWPMTHFDDQTAKDLEFGGQNAVVEPLPEPNDNRPSNSIASRVNPKSASGFRADGGAQPAAKVPPAVGENGAGDNNALPFAIQCSTKPVSTSAATEQSMGFEALEDKSDGFPRLCELIRDESDESSPSH